MSSAYFERDDTGVVLGTTTTTFAFASLSMPGVVVVVVVFVVLVVVHHQIVVVLVLVVVAGVLPHTIRFKELWCKFKRRERRRGFVDDAQFETFASGTLKRHVFALGCTEQQGGGGKRTYKRTGWVGAAELQKVI